MFNLGEELLKIIDAITEGVVIVPAYAGVGGGGCAGCDGRCRYTCKNTCDVQTK